MSLSGLNGLAGLAGMVPSGVAYGPQQEVEILATAEGAWYKAGTTPDMLDTSLSSAQLYVYRGRIGDGRYFLYVACFLFDTSIIPDAAIVDEVDFKGHFSQIYDVNNRSLQAEFYPFDGTIAVGDFTTVPANDAGDWDVTGIVANAINTLPMTNVANINKAGNTGLRFHMGNGSGGTIAGDNNQVLIATIGDATPANRPRIVVRYREPL